MRQGPEGVTAERPTTILLTEGRLDGGPDIIRSLRADAKLAALIVGVNALRSGAGAR